MSTMNEWDYTPTAMARGHKKARNKSGLFYTAIRPPLAVLVALLASLDMLFVGSATRTTLLLAIGTRS
jgi:hypothetical protein